MIASRHCRSAIASCAVKGVPGREGEAPAEPRSSRGSAGAASSLPVGKAGVKNFRVLGRALALLWLGGLPTTAVAGDWPQILGPQRNGTADGETIRPWSADGPPTVWTYPLGQGYAGAAVADGRVVIFHRLEAVERVEALDATTGRRLWATDLPASYAGGIDPDKGPRCVPLIHQGYVYLFGAAGDLYCVALATGARRWSHATSREFAADEGYFGAGSSPLVAGDTLLVHVGGKNAGIVAFALRDGRVRWQATDERASYSSPALATIGGQSHAIFVTRLNTISLDPANGQVRFRFPFGRRGATVNAATPLVFDGQLFVTANYGVGALLATIGADDAPQVWASDDVLSSQYPTPVFAGGYLYGMHGREDVGVPDLRCVDARTGTVQWSEPGFGMAHLILAGDRLLIQAVDGRLLLAAVSPQRFHTLATAHISQATTRALPALAAGKLYVRETDGPRGRLVCLQL